MKHTFFLVIVLIISSCASAQISEKSILAEDQNLKMDTTYFLLGTLSEYNGRFWQINKPDQVDRYNVYEEPLVDFQRDLILNHETLTRTKVIFLQRPKGFANN
jgi:hypothetical protein